MSYAKCPRLSARDVNDFAKNCTLCILNAIAFSAKNTFVCAMDGIANASNSHVHGVFCCLFFKCSAVMALFCSSRACTAVYDA